jgi:hypothetical protein
MSFPLVRNLSAKAYDRRKKKNSGRANSRPDGAAGMTARFIILNSL